MQRLDLTGWLTREFCEELGHGCVGDLKSQDLNQGIYKIELTNELTGKSVLFSIKVPEERDTVPQISCIDEELSSQITMYIMDNFERLQLKPLLQKCIQFYGTAMHAVDDDDDWGSDDDPEDGSWEDDDIMVDVNNIDEDIIPIGMVSQQKYIALQSKLVRVAEEIRENHVVREHEEELVKNNIFNPKSVSLMLAKQLVHFKKNFDNGDATFKVDPINDNVYTWNIKIRRFDAFSNLHDDILALKQQHGYDYVELEMEFLMDIFPFFPPSVKLVRPRIENFVFARIVTMPELQLSQWNPTSEIITILANIKTLLEQFGRVKAENPVNCLRDGLPPFTEIEYQLLRLSMLTETPARCVALQMDKNPVKSAIGVQNLKSKSKTNDIDIEPSSSDQPAASAAKGRKKGAKAWASGTGYGHVGDDSSWDIAAWEKAQRRKNSEVMTVLQTVAQELKKNAIPEQVVLESCLLPYLHEKCANDSLNDMGMHFELYSTIFREVINNLLEHKGLLPLFHEHMNNQTLIQRIATLSRKCKLVRNMAKDIDTHPEEIEVKQPQKSDRYSYFHTRKAKGHVSENAAKNYAFQLATMICDVYDKYLSLAEKNVDDAEEEEVLGAELDLVPENYIKIMRECAFDTIDHSFAYHHYINKKKVQVQRNRKLIKRLASEFSDLPAGLPIDFDSSVFFRANESNVSFCQMLIIPCDGTPYASGCFLFDICFPTQYPLVPPLVNLQTTGKGSIRFNPNLYNCGKVCLSLLGTWSGANQGEQWNPGLSTMFQVALSIQSLIFVPQPYFNEPGYEAQMGTPEGDKRNKAYNEEREKATIKWAIIDKLENPPKPFKDVIRKHFIMSKERVIANCVKWVGKKDPLTKKVQKLLDNLK